EWTLSSALDQFAFRQSSPAMMDRKNHYVILEYPIDEPVSAELDLPHIGVIGLRHWMSHLGMGLHKLSGIQCVQMERPGAGWRILRDMVHNGIKIGPGLGTPFHSRHLRLNSSRISAMEWTRPSNASALPLSILLNNRILSIRSSTSNASGISFNVLRIS